MTTSVLAPGPLTFGGVEHVITVPWAFTETFEPGSLAKIFAAAALIAFDRVRPTERVSGEGGHYRLPDRVVTDEHTMPSTVNDEPETA